MLKLTFQVFNFCDFLQPWMFNNFNNFQNYGIIKYNATSNYSDGRFLSACRHGTEYTVIWEIFVAKKFSYSSMFTKIKHTKCFQCAYYVIECELNYHRLWKFFNTNIFHTNIFNTKIFQTTVSLCIVCIAIAVPTNSL